VVLDLLRGVRHLGPQYLVDSVREVECARLGYMTRLSRLHIPDPPLRIAFLKGGHLATRDPSRKIAKGPQVGRRYLKQTAYDNIAQLKQR
jgi:hypothetical protein